MGDLDQQIRDQLDPELGMVTKEQLRAGILAVIEHHRNYREWYSFDGFSWPCVTVRDMAAALGVQEGGDRD